MATIDKNFRVKNGLIVEGTTGTINGNNILTESAGDSYILNLVGGATLVKSVDTNVFTVDGSGYLTLNSDVVTTTGTQTLTNKTLENVKLQGQVDFLTSGGSFEALEGFDGNTNFVIDADYGIVIQGSGQYLHNDQPQNQIATEGYVDSSVSNAISSSESYADNAANNALNSAKSYTDSALSTAESYADAAKASAITTAEGYTDAAIATEATNRNSAIATAKSQAISTSNAYTDSAIAQEVTDRNSAISAQSTLDRAYTDLAKSSAITAAEGYTDAAISAEVTRANGAYDPTGSAASAETAAKSYADSVAQTAQNNAEGYADTVATNAENAAKTYADGVGTSTLNASKSYTDTAVANLVDSAPAILDTLKKIDLAINNDANFSTTILGDIATAQATAEGYTDSAIATEVTNRNSAIASAASQAVSTSETYADNLVANGNVNAEPTYKGVKLGNYTELVSGWNYTSNGSTFVPLTWNQNYGTAKLTVHVRSGVHTQASEILVAKDQSNNLHITEYAIVTTNGALADISVTANGSDISVTVTPTAGHDQTEAVASGSVIVWAD